MDDALVIGSGPNGLAAAATLAQAGWRVRILEAQPRPGGALFSLETTLPGYIHDVGAAFFPFAHLSPALQQLRLDEFGLQWRGGVYESAHPAPDGTCVAIARDIDRAARSFGADGDAWRWLATWQAGMGQRLADAAAGALASGGAFLEARRPRISFRSFRHARGISSAALAIRAGCSAPRRPGASFRGCPCTSISALKTFPAPRSAWCSACSRQVTVSRSPSAAPARSPMRWSAASNNMAASCNSARVSNPSSACATGRAVAVRTETGAEIPAAKAILADVGAPALYLRLLPESSVPGWVRQSIQRFQYGWGTFKMDWALAGPVPWSAAQARQAAVVHAGDSIDDLIRFTNEARAGLLPSNPYLVIGQQSLLDPTRAPSGCQTLWAYSRVPSQLHDGWPAHKEAFADRIEQRIEGLAPGFRGLIRGRAIFAPDDLERMNENLVGGDLGGGSAQFTQQLFWRPTFPYFRYRTPVKGVYLCSASAHPGAGVHGACGYNAARTAAGRCFAAQAKAERAHIMPVLFFFSRASP